MAFADWTIEQASFNVITSDRVSPTHSIQALDGGTFAFRKADPLKKNVRMSAFAKFPGESSNQPYIEFCVRCDFNSSTWYNGKFQFSWGDQIQLTLSRGWSQLTSASFSYAGMTNWTKYGFKVTNENGMIRLEGLMYQNDIWVVKAAAYDTLAEGIDAEGGWRVAGSSLIKVDDVVLEELTQ